MLLHLLLFYFLPHPSKLTARLAAMHVQEKSKLFPEACETYQRAFEILVPALKAGRARFGFHFFGYL